MTNFFSCISHPCPVFFPWNGTCIYFIQPDSVIWFGGWNFCGLECFVDCAFPPLCPSELGLGYVCLLGKLNLMEGLKAVVAGQGSLNGFSGVKCGLGALVKKMVKTKACLLCISFSSSLLCNQKHLLKRYNYIQKSPSPTLSYTRIVEAVWDHLLLWERWPKPREAPSRQRSLFLQTCNDDLLEVTIIEQICCVDIHRSYVLTVQTHKSLKLCVRPCVYNVFAHI